MRSAVLLNSIDDLELAIEAQSHFGIECHEPDCSVPPQLINWAREVLVESRTVVDRLILGLDDDAGGVPEIVYEATYDLIRQVYGDCGAKEFSNRVDTTEGRFYLDHKIDSGNGNAAIKAIREAKQ